MECHYFEGLDHTLNITLCFLKGEIPAGYRAIFSYVGRIAPGGRKN